MYFDIEIGGVEEGRIEMELYSESLPKTADNFFTLCTGSKGEVNGIRMTYEGSLFYRVIKGFMIQGGDFTKGDGTGGVSIYGNKFDDEKFLYKHDKKYLLSMANAGPNTNGSQFFITTSTPSHLDGKHVVFGEVIKGTEIVDKIEGLETKGDKPTQDVRIIKCGELGI